MKKLIRDIDDTSPSVEAAFDMFITSKRSEGRQEATIRSYRTSFKDFKQFCNKNKITDISKINKKTIESYKTHLLDLDVTMETRNTYLRAVKAVIYYLFDAEDLTPFRIKLFPAPSKEHISTYDDNDLKKLIESEYKDSTNFSQIRDYYMMITLLLTGIRRSTLANMMIEDIDFENKKIYLRHVKRDNEFKLKEIPLNADLENALKKYLKLTRLKEQKIKYLFPNVEGKMLIPDTVTKCINKLCKDAGVSPRGCHEFRRTFATKCYNKLDDIEKTRKLMLISDSRVLKHYINEDISTLQESSQQLNFVTQIQSPQVLKDAAKKDPPKPRKNTKKS